MSKKVFATGWLLVFWLTIQPLLAFSANNQDYKERWKRIEKFEKDNLPKSAISELEDIIKMATKSNDFEQMLKAMIFRSNNLLRIDENANQYRLIKDFEEQLHRTQDVSQRALLNSLLAELYFKAYNGDRWSIDARTNLESTTPDDINEWTKANFFRTIRSYIEASVKDAEYLQSVKIPYRKLGISNGGDDALFFPTLYDFLMRRATLLLDDAYYIEPKTMPNEVLAEFVALPLQASDAEIGGEYVMQLYQKRVASLLQRGLKDGAILTEVERLQWMGNHWDREPQVCKILRKLRTNSPNSVAQIDVIAALCEMYGDRTDEDKKQKMQWLEEGLSIFKGVKRATLLQSLKADLEKPTIRIEASKCYASKQKKVLNLTYVNLQKVTVNIYSSDKKTLITKVSANLPLSNTYAQHSHQLELPELPIGNYYAEVNYGNSTKNESAKQKEKFRFSVSDLFFAGRSTVSNSGVHVYVAHRTTGKPIEGATVQIYKENVKNLVKTQTTNEFGIAEFEAEAFTSQNDYRGYIVRVFKGQDKPDVEERLYYGNYRSSSREDKEQYKLSLLTDRSVYRPGQTVYFKLIAAKGNNGENAAAEGMRQEAVLKDVNGKEVARRQLITNEFGSASGEFVLPQSVLPGWFSLVCNNVSTSLQVAEYKRPTFQVQFHKLTDSYKYGKEVTVRGAVESFSGIKLQNASVEYVIWRYSGKNIWFREDDSRTKMADGKLTTDGNGGFEVKFLAHLPSDESIEAEEFAIEARVTDGNGETQVGETSVVMSKQAITLFNEIDGLFLKDKVRPLRILAYNMQGQQQNVRGTYEVFTSDEKGALITGVLKGEFVSGEQPQLQKQISNLTSGYYALVSKTTDADGVEVKKVSPFLAYSYADKQPPYTTNKWFHVINDTIAPNRPAKVLLGVSDKDVYVLYELAKNGKVQKRNIVPLNGENRIFTLPYSEEYANGAEMHFTFVKGGELTQHSASIKKAEKPTRLTVKLATFRDKLIPGTQEEWRLTVTDGNKSAVSAEVLASMYDMALDKIYRSHDWVLNRTYWRSPARLGHYTTFGNNLSLWGQLKMPAIKVYDYRFSRFNWFEEASYLMPPLLKSRISFEGMDMVVLNEPQSSSMVMSVGEVRGKAKAAEKNTSLRDELPQNVGIRKNFSETAFFYPHLRTDKNGEVVISFVVPESNTRWRFRALAHNKQIHHGSDEKQIVTQKQLMVTPHLPRFVRTGDITTLTTKVSNLSETPLSGNVRLECFDILTDERISLEIKDREQNINIPKGESAFASWTVKIPDGQEAIGIRIVATANGMSDGEQHALPVLSNRTLVTESMPMLIRSGEAKRLNFNELVMANSATTKRKTFTVEMSANPAWYAIQALPSLVQPTSDDAISWFIGYSANRLGSFIPQKYPQVARVVQAWTQKGGTAETLLSALQKNEELKNILLHETPWVLQAESEVEQKQNLALLFDLNRATDQAVRAINKLKEMQTADGGFAWFNGFSPSFDITQYILFGMKRLQQIDGKNENSEMLVRAVQYIDREVATRFAREQNPTHLATWQMEYLYIRSLYADVVPTPKARQAIDYYTRIAEKTWQKSSLYKQSLLVPILLSNGNKALSNKVIASLRELATTSPEMGMYWANNKESVFFAQLALGVHTFLTDAFAQSGASATEMDELKLWLLRQKQANGWNNSLSTIVAAYTLLSTGNNWFDGSGNITLQVGDNKIDTSKSEVGTGYTKHQWRGDAIQPEMKHITVKNAGTAPAYGAAYVQYTEQADKVQQHTAKELSVTKILMKEVNGSSGKALQELATDATLEVGDRVVVRLVVRTDRSMDFVHLKDMRAACFEPVEQLSGIRWNASAMYYMSNRDASTSFYFNHLPKGTYVLEYAVQVARKGEYQNGIATVQCLYAPEFVSHSQGSWVKIR